MDEEKVVKNEEVEEVEVVEEVVVNETPESELKEEESATDDERDVVQEEVITEKRSLNKTLVIVGVIVLVAVLVMAGWLIKNYIDKNSNSSSVTEAANYTNGQPIKIDQKFYTAFFYVKQQQTTQAQQFASIDSQNAYWADQKNIDTLRKETLDYVKNQTLILIKAKKDGFSLTPEEIEKAKTDLTTSYMTQYKTVEKIEEEMQKSYHITFDDIKQIVVDITLVNKYQTEGPKKLAATISDADAKAYFNANPGKFKNVTVRHILITNTDAKTGAKLTGAKLAAAKKLANNLLKRVNAGEDMAKLAAKYSQDPGVKDNKGIYEVNADARLVQSFKDFALNNPKGTTAVVVSDYGFHVMRVENVANQVLDAATLTKVKEAIAKEKFQTELDAFIAAASKVISNQAELDKLKPDVATAPVATAPAN